MGKTQGETGLIGVGGGLKEVFTCLKKGMGSRMLKYLQIF